MKEIEKMEGLWKWASGRMEGGKEGEKDLGQRFLVICHDLWVAPSPLLSPVQHQQVSGRLAADLAGISGWHPASWRSWTLTSRVIGLVCSWPVLERLLTGCLTE